MLEKTMTDKTDPFLHGLIEVLGEQDAADFQDSRLAGTLPLEDRVTEGILIRAGRAGFSCWLRQNQADLGWTDKEFRFKSVKSKIRAGLEDILEQLRLNHAVHITLVNEPDTWKLVVESAREQPNDLPPLPCAYLRGFVQEFCRWAGIGKFYAVDQQPAISSNGNPACEITILKNPLD